jgi:hypothetical protein
MGRRGLETENYSYNIWLTIHTIEKSNYIINLGSKRKFSTLNEKLRQ